MAHNPAADITPASLGRMYVKRNDKILRDKPVAYTPDGKRIFAYNADGQPICYSNRGGKYDEKGNQLRCQSTMTMHNGRCKIHGGKSLSGVMHPRATNLRSAESLPRHMRADFERALLDPDILSLNHEIGLVDIEVKGHKEDLGSDITEGGAKKMDGLILSLQDKLENCKEITEDDLKTIVATWQATQHKRATFSRLHVCYEMRRKLVDTASKREQQLKTMIRADQAMALIVSIAASCRDCVTNLLSDIEKRYIIIDRQNPILVHDVEGKALKVRMLELEVIAIDKGIKLDFLNQVSIKLGGLIGKAREGIPDMDPRDQREGGLFAADTILPDLEHPMVPSTDGRKLTGEVKRARQILAMREEE